MAPARKYDVGVKYAVVIQQSHRIVKKKLCGECIKISVLGITLSICKIRSVPSSSVNINKRDYGSR